MVSEFQLYAGMRLDEGEKMSNQAQIDAVEQLLMALLKTSSISLDPYGAFKKAHELLAGENGPADLKAKGEAAEYLNRLKLQLKS